MHSLQGEYACYCQDTCAKCDTSEGTTLAVKKGAGALDSSCGTGLVCDDDGANTACVSTLVANVGDAWGAGVLDSPDDPKNNCPLLPFAGASQEEQVPLVNIQIVTFAVSSLYYVVE